MKRTTLILSAIISVLALAVVGLLLFINSRPAPNRGLTPLVAITPMEPNAEKWGENYPNQYSTLLKTESNAERTAFGGSLNFSRLEEDPRLLTLFAGYPFSIDYNEERGHLNSLVDVRATGRINEKTAGTCYSCKSADNPRLWEQMGMADYDKTPFSALGEQIDNPIGCANCHEANTMRLIVTNPALEEALVAQGRDWRSFTRQEMRTVVCANCHVEYYFKGDGKYLTFPWADGTNIDNIAQFYNDLQFKDWDHPQSGAAMIKMQHPEYEMFTNNSTHFNAGVACADCHMPYTRDGAAKFSTHDVRSPLLNAEVACGQCHTDVEYVTNRVSIIQNQVHGTLIATEDALVAAILAIESAAAAEGVDSTLIGEARQLHRAAQLRWDFVAAENSMGFHNPEEALRILAAATDLARQAQLKAVLAGGTPPVVQTGSN